MANFRPVSNLSFLSKAVEKAVAQQLNDHLAKYNLLRPTTSSVSLKPNSIKLASSELAPNMFGASSELVQS